MTTETPEEKARRLGVPLIRRPLEPAHIPGDPNPVTAVCECGLEIRRVMGYVCTRARCPNGLGAGE